MADNESPLVKALPPASDYLTYLTIVEYNLKAENLPILHKVLQDETLAINIGWDLVHLLVPLLPDSEQCLKDVAHLGNPREVILKVTESLRLIEYDDPNEDEEVKEGEAEVDVRARAESSTYPLKTATSESSKVTGALQAVELPPPLPLPVNQFIALLSMLTILHPRIKTKFPSRFLSTSLQAVLASFSNSAAHREEMIEAIVTAIKAMSGVQRPTLPSRKSSGVINHAASAVRPSAGDPEGNDDSVPSTEEKAIQKKLLQSFITHVIEEYLLNLPQYEDIPGMAWSSRVMEKTHPERQIPEVARLTDRFNTDEKLQRRVEAVGQLLAVAKDLGVTDEDLLHAAISEEKVPVRTGDEEEPPKSANDISLSKLGSLFVYAARQASNLLYQNISRKEAPFVIFPDHHELLKNCLASADMGIGQLGTEPEALIDAVLALGLICLEGNSIGAPHSDEDFNHYLQTNAFLSSNCPNSNLRGHAHYVTSTVLRSQPDDKVRLDFIRDTLEHCPYENLKVSAVGWIKGETIEANSSALVPEGGHSHDEHPLESDDKSIFATPVALESLGPFLFPPIRDLIVEAPIQEAWQDFQANVSFYLASLNFLYLLLSAKQLQQHLEVGELWTNNHVESNFLQPLKEAKARFETELAENGSLASEKDDRIMGELVLLDETLQQVTSASSRANLK